MLRIMTVLLIAATSLGCPARASALADRAEEGLQDAVSRHLQTLASPSNVWISHVWFTPGTHHRVAIDALARIGAPAVGPLIAMLSVPEPERRYMATLALAKIRDPRSVEPLIRVFQHDQVWGVQEGAAEALAELRDPRAVQPLLQALDTGDEDPLRYVVYALRRFPEPSVIRALSALLSRTPKRMRVDIGRLAAISLGEMGSPALDAILESARSPNPAVRSNAATALIRFDDDREVRTQISLLRDPDKNVRSHAAYLLGEKKEKRALTPLIAALQDVTEVRICAAEALGKLGDPSAAAPLVASLSSADGEVLHSTIDTLGKLRARVAVEPLLSRLRSTEGVTRYHAAQALGQIGDARALNGLLAAANDREALGRMGAARALAAFPNPRALRKLLLLVRDPDPAVREAACGGLGGQSDRQAIAPLLTALEDESEGVRREAARALGAIAGDDAIAPLRKMIERDSRNYPVYSVAKEAIKKIQQRGAAKGDRR